MDEQPYSVTPGDGQPFPYFPPFTDENGHVPRFLDLTSEQQRECIRRKRMKHTWRAAYTWAHCAALEGTHGESYLKTLGIVPPYSDVLRYHPSLYCPLVSAKLPAIVAPLAQLGEAEKIQAITAIWLDPHSASALRFTRQESRRVQFQGDRYRAAYGLNRTGIVNLDPFEDRLLVSRRIETAMAASQVLGLPAVAAFSVYDVIADTLPPSVRSVVIAVNAGPSAGGEGLAAALSSKGVAVEIVRPPDALRRWIDVTKATP